jgi:hypothetical protein
MNNLLVSQAKYKHHWYTPAQFLTKLELQNKSKKRTGEKLQCADGCDLIFKNGCEYINHFGTVVIRHSHFAHTSKQRETSCLMLKKYSGGGESEEHLKTKMAIAENNNLRFMRQCSDPDCNRTKRKYISNDWYTKLEHKVNNKWLVDVAFFNKKTDKLELVLEVMHKHAVDGKKREWLLEQDFLYFEVASNTESNTHIIIDAEGTYYCTIDVNFPCYCQLGENKRKWKKEQRRKWIEKKRKEREEYKRRAEQLEREAREAKEKRLELERIEKEQQRMNNLERIEKEQQIVKELNRINESISFTKERQRRLKKRQQQRSKDMVMQQQRDNATDEEKFAESKRVRARKKQQEKREELKQLAIQKKSVGYQKKINNNRKAFGMKKRKLQSSISGFFKSKK